MIKKFILLVILVVSLNAATKNVNNVKIQEISLHSDTNSTFIQIEPRHSIEGLKCTDNYWLRLDHNDIAYKETLSMLITAKVSKLNVFISMTDDNKDSQFCRMYRIVLQ